MARRVASGRLGLSCPYPASECTSESEAESVKETSQHRAPKNQEQQRCGWQPGEGAEPWDLSEDRTESESDLEPALRSSPGEAEKQNKKNNALFSFCLLPFPIRFPLLWFFLQELSILSARVLPSEQVRHSLMGINRDEC